MPNPKHMLGMKAGKVEKTADEYAAVADALEVATGKRPSDEEAEAFCLAVMLAMEKHGEGDY